MDFQDGYELVQTCGVCEEICNQEDIKNHSCLEGYSYYSVDPNTLYFYPLTENNTIVRRSTINNTEQLVEESFHHEHRNNIISLQKTGKRKVFRQLENTDKKRTKLNENTGNKLNFDDEEVIILEVQKRPQLWDYSLPLVQRKNNIKQKLWTEISAELNGKVSADEVQKKFKSLHDTFRKLIQSEQRPSGSARKDTTPKWSHYESMSFLKGHCLSKSTVSNIDIEDTRVFNSSPINIEDDTENFPTDFGEKKKKKINNNASTAMERIADALCKESNIILPPPPESDEIDSFLSLLGFRLRKMPPKSTLKTMQRILEITYEILMQEDCDI